jgi:hypothetical protein
MQKCLKILLEGLQGKHPAFLSYSHIRPELQVQTTYFVECKNIFVKSAKVINTIKYVPWILVKFFYKDAHHIY